MRQDGRKADPKRRGRGAGLLWKRRGRDERESGRWDWKQQDMSSEGRGGGKQKS